MKLKIAFIHYVVGTKGGVNSVMYANAKALLDLHKDINVYFVGSIKGNLIEGYGNRVKYIDFPELDISERIESGFVKKTVFDYMRDGLDICEKLNSSLKKMDAIIIENPNLAANPAATYSFYRLAKRLSQQNSKTKVLFRIHDFAEDRDVNFNNILKFTGSEHCPYWHKILFPKLKNLRYIIINSTDRRRLWSHGIIKDESVFYIPNPINELLIEEDTEFSEKLRKKLIRDYKLKNDVRFIFYPVRIVKRKNVEEAIFLTMMLCHLLRKNYCLIVSLRTNKKIDDAYTKTLDKYVKKYKLPVILGVNDCVGLMRKFTKSKKLIHFGIGDAYNISDFAISTSILEGFGLVFIESWFFNKVVIGRDLPDVTEDFKSAGINLHNLYTNILVDNKDFKDYTTAEKFNIINRLSNNKFRQSIIEGEKEDFAAIVSVLDGIKSKKLINHNRKAVLQNYGQRKIARKLVNIAKMKLY
ncbi:MAG: hypothetical protein KAU20_03440 [Nanoarchaeota archaeon]|nr:hypothetical protein [Nanoarchaeota archaeon]